MKTTIELLGETFTIEGHLVARGVKFPYDNTGRTTHNRYSIDVNCGDNNISFNFYDSQSNLGKSELDEQGLKDAFGCLLSDACSGDMSFGDFRAEFGEGSQRVVYNACVRQLHKVNQLTDSDIYDLINTYNEVYA